MDDQMRQDLQAASTSTLELAPQGSGQKVVSSIEQTGLPRPGKTAHGPAEPPSDTTVTQTAASSADPAAIKPLPKSSVSPPPPGGYKSIGHVIKNAPFPINP